MDNSNKSIENLIQKADDYTRTTLKLYKYEAIFKSAEIVSDISVKLALTTIISMFLFLINVGISLWIGQQLGKDYYGFFVLAFVYLFFIFLIYIFREKWIQNSVSNYIITKMKNKIVS